MYHYYLTQSRYLVSAGVDPDVVPPFGWTVYSSDQEDLLGAFIAEDGAISMPLPVVTSEPPKSYTAPQAERQSFVGTSLFKKARIKANKDHLLAFQVSLALYYDQQGDYRAANGAISAVRAIMRKRHGYRD